MAADRAVFTKAAFSAKSGHFRGNWGVDHEYTHRSGKRGKQGKNCAYGIEGAFLLGKRRGMNIPTTALMDRSTRVKSVVELLGQPPPATTGRDRLIAAGMELFYREGFHAVGLDRVIEYAGVTKTTFYKHFEAKDDLVLACVTARDAWEMEAWERGVKEIAGNDPRGQLIAFFDVLDEWFNEPSFHGCMYINVATEFPDKRSPIHQAGAKHKREARDYFRSLAEKAGAKDAEEFADHFTILIDGTLVLRHVHGQDDAAQVARSAVMDLIERHMPSPRRLRSA